MANTEERLRKLVDENLEFEGRQKGTPLNLDSSLRDSGASSVDLVAFAKLIDKEFDVELSPEDCDNYSSIGELISALDSQAS